MTEPGEVQLLRKALTGAVADLTGTRRLTVVELATEGIVAWELRRDPADIPRGRSWAVSPWSGLHEGARLSEQAIVRAARVPRGGDDVTILVSTSPDRARTAETRTADAALDRIGIVRPGLQHFRCPSVRISGLLRDVIANDPLTRLYELVTLRETPSGRLELGCSPLFPVGAQRGATTQLTVRCKNCDDQGIVFAVVAAVPDTRLFRPVIVRSAKLNPGVYHLTAELHRPGLVQFHGLPVALAHDDRPWSDLVAAVPDRLEPPPAARHLICAIEISGPSNKSEQVAERISRAGQLIATAASHLWDRLRVSVISYGPHSFERNAPEVPVVFQCWDSPPDEALARLRSLRGRDVVTTGYTRAAQLECVLTRLADRLETLPAGAKTALLTIGDLPPSPARANPSEILPCPWKHDWTAALDRLRDNQDVAFAAICDTVPERADRVWYELGGGPPAQLDAVDPHQVCRALGLTPPAVQLVPFPFTETE